MNKKYLLIAILVVSFFCTGCGNKDEVPNHAEDVTNITIESGEKINSDSIEIIEDSDKVVINMYDDLTTEYIFSGDFAIEKNNIYHFESEEKANDFASSFKSGDNVTVDGMDVIIKSNDPSDLKVIKKDLMDTYSVLKEEYENEGN